MHKNKTKKKTKTTSLKIHSRSHIKKNINHGYASSDFRFLSQRCFLEIPLFFALCYACGVVLVVPRERQMQDIPFRILP